MTRTAIPKPTRVKVREQGLRPAQIWIPDMCSPDFQAEAHRQSIAVAASALADEDQVFIDSVAV
jgi:hypothetical protein